MRHRHKVRKLGKKRAHRIAMLSNMACSLIIYEYVETTTAKARACKSFVDHLMSLGKKAEQKAATFRKIESMLRDPVAAEKLVKVLAPRYKERVGGYVSIIKSSHRAGDNASMAKLVLIGSKAFRKKKKAIKVRTRGRRKVEHKDKVQRRKGEGMIEKVRRFGRKRSTQKNDSVVKEAGGTVQDVPVRSRSGI